MGVGDVSKLSYDNVCELFKIYSRGNSKVGGGPRDPSSKLVTSVVEAGVTRIEMGNSFENFKTDILSTFSSQLVVFQAKNKQEKQDELEKALAVF